MADVIGLLVAGFDSSAAREDEFNDWYDTEHMPERTRIEGFGRCERWLGFENPKIAIATYDLQSLQVLRSGGYAMDREDAAVFSATRCASHSVATSGPDDSLSARLCT